MLACLLELAGDGLLLHLLFREAHLLLASDSVCILMVRFVTQKAEYRDFCLHL